jgi:hypothetical protein
MIFSVLFKFIMFYFLFVFIKGMFQTYKAYKLVKQRQSDGDSPQQQQRQSPSQERTSSNRNSDIIDAEFRVLDKNS